jgi:hypothetical protein
MTAMMTNRTRATLFVLLAGLHCVIALCATVYAYVGGSAHFDNPELPLATGATAAVNVANVLTLPGRFVWTSWNLSHVIEWPLFMANSAVWGGFGVTITTLLTKSFAANRDTQWFATMMRRHAIALIVAGVAVIAADGMARVFPGMAVVILLPGHFIAGLPTLLAAVLSSSGMEIITDVETVWPTIMAVLFWWGVTFGVLSLTEQAA